MKISKSANFFIKIAKIYTTIEIPVPDVLFTQNVSILNIANVELVIQNFPGHSPGSCIIKIDNYLFSGDILYKNGIGLGSIPKEDINVLKKSIMEIFDRFPENSLILPGHGNFEKLKYIKSNNYELLQFLNL